MLRIQAQRNLSSHLQLWFCQASTSLSLFHKHETDLSNRLCSESLCSLTYKEKNAASKHFARKPAQREKGIAYLDERNEATMMHTRSILPFETSNFERACVHGSKEDCKVGFECPSTTKFDDKLVGKNAFLDDNGNYCNCWRNSHVDKWIPLLDSALQMLHSWRPQSAEPTQIALDRALVKLMRCWLYTILLALITGMFHTVLDYATGK